MEAITVRKMGFEFPADLELIFIRGEPLLSYTFLGTWMLLPHLEPCLIRTMRDALPRIESAPLRAEVQAFCAQEGQHYREHARANDAIRTRRTGFGRLAELEREIAAEYASFTRDRSLRWNLAYAEGFEALTAAQSRLQFEERVFERMTGPLRDLMEWHIMEEIEHRTVAFDVYRALYGGYLFRLAVGLWAQWHFLSRALRLAGCMVRADRESFAPALRSRSRAWLVRYALRAIPRVLHLYMPWYDPRRIPMPEACREARDRYTRSARHVAFPAAADGGAPR
jgi:predicted metal-dependent hydrolase